MKICKVEGCFKKYGGNGYCGTHYMQIRNRGKILTRTMFTKNEIFDRNEYLEMALYDRKQDNIIAFCKFDKEDLGKVSKYKWRNNHGYATTGNAVKFKMFSMHRLILNFPNLDIDHINGNTLDNRKENLRLVNQQQNTFNSHKKASASSVYKGVSLINSKKWRAYIVKNNKQIHLGTFNSEIKAAKAYNLKAKELFGEFANLNLV